jgi:hypothetical protein
MSKLINICQTHGSIYLSITSYDIGPNRRICDSKFCSGFEAVLARPKNADLIADFTHFLVQRLPCHGLRLSENNNM